MEIKHNHLRLGGLFSKNTKPHLKSLDSIFPPFNSPSFYQIRVKEFERKINRKKKEKVSFHSLPLSSPTLSHSNFPSPPSKLPRQGSKTPRAGHQTQIDSSFCCHRARAPSSPPTFFPHPCLTYSLSSVKEPQPQNPSASSSSCSHGRFFPEH